jgi:hypothetical protein
MAAAIQVVNYSYLSADETLRWEFNTLGARKEFIMSTRTARECLYIAVAASAAFTICPVAVAVAAPANVQCYPTVVGIVCLDLTPFPWVSRPSDYLCMADPPDPGCVIPSLPPDASVRSRLPNGEWSSSPVPVSALPPPLSGGWLPAPLPKDQWPDSGAGNQGSTPVTAYPGTPPVPGDRWEPVLPGGPPPAVAAPKPAFIAGH